MAVWKRTIDHPERGGVKETSNKQQPQQVQTGLMICSPPVPPPRSLCSPYAAGCSRFLHPAVRRGLWWFVEQLTSDTSSSAPARIRQLAKIDRFACFLGEENDSPCAGPRSLPLPALFTGALVTAESTLSLTIKIALSHAVISTARLAETKRCLTDALYTFTRDSIHKSYYDKRSTMCLWSNS